MSDENVGGFEEWFAAQWGIGGHRQIALSAWNAALSARGALLFTQADMERFAGYVADAREERLKSAHGENASVPQPVVDEALVERACRAVCASNGWNPDEPVTYSGTRKLVRHPDGSKVLQWEMHAATCRVALTAALTGATP